jgi:hypothetical protein
MQRYTLFDPFVPKIIPSKVKECQLFVEGRFVILERLYSIHLHVQQEKT